MLIGGAGGLAVFDAFGNILDFLSQNIESRFLGDFAVREFEVSTPTLMRYSLGAPGGDATQGSGNHSGSGGGGGGSVLEKLFNTVNDNRYVFHNGEGGIGGGVGNADADGGNGALNDAGFGAAGGAGGGAGASTAGSSVSGGNGANGGAAPGWMRPFGDPAAGCVQIWRLS